MVSVGNFEIDVTVDMGCGITLHLLDRSKTAENQTGSQKVMHVRLDHVRAGEVIEMLRKARTMVCSVGGGE